MTRELMTTGEHEGWTRWRREPDGRFTSMLGDFYFRADASGARFALIFGQAELAQGCVALKPLRGAPQEQVIEPLSQVEQWAARLR